MSRPIEVEYTDPLDLVWIHAAHLAGMAVVRDPEVNASWDGRGTLRIGTSDILDADDCLAQMILHEMCHALVAGENGLALADWGLEYGNNADQVFEKAALRLQAAFADRFGLRLFLASTTIYREYYDAIGPEPLAGEDPAASRARTAMSRAVKIGWLSIINDALRATRAIADTVARCAGDLSLWSLAAAHQRDGEHQRDGSGENNGNHGSGENATATTAH